MKVGLNIVPDCGLCSWGCPHLIQTKDEYVCKLYGQVLQYNSKGVRRPVNCAYGNRISRLEMYKLICQTVALRSSCVRKKVGAIIVSEGRIISTAYNGPISGVDCKECLGASCNRSIHAEMNAIVFAAKAGISIEGADMYVTLSPCINCAKILANSGIKNVYYLEQYRDIEGIKFLENCNNIDICGI